MLRKAKKRQTAARESWQRKENPTSCCLILEKKKINRRRYVRPDDVVERCSQTPSLQMTLRVMVSLRKVQGRRA